MHAQRCPVAKLLAASQQNKGKAGAVPNLVDPTAGTHLQKRGQGIKSIMPSKEKPRAPQRFQPPRSQEKPSFFQNLHGDAAPLLPPCPQMYSDDNWVQTFSGEKANVYTKDKGPPRKRCEHPDVPQVFSANCTIHGPHARRGSRHFVFPKSVSCPTPARIDSRQTANAERLKNWRRSSLTIPGNNGRGLGGVVTRGQQKDGASQQHHHYRHYHGPQPCTSPLPSTPSTTTPSPSTMCLTKNIIPDDLQSRRSQFRKAFSFFSIGCDEMPKDKQPPQRILRQPTRHIYRRGISGLPIECTNRSVGVAF